MMTLPGIAFLLLILSALTQAVSLFFGRRLSEESISRWLLAAAALFVVLGIVKRSMAIGFPSLTGTYESLLFYSAAVCTLSSVYGFQKKVRLLPEIQFGATITALVLLSLASSPLIPDEVLPPIPALRSYWLVAHVAFTFIGESFFIISFVASVAYLTTGNIDRKTEYDRIAYISIALGFPIFTTGALIFGAIWAEQAWGSWWSWDPKETWALVTWLVYSLYLHLRLVSGRRRAICSIVAVAGFLCTLFTFFGVNYLLPGLHSYG